MSASTGDSLSGAQAALAAAKAALGRADWTAARQGFESALQEQDSPEGRDGLGIALWWLNDIHAAHQQRTLAYIAYKKRGDLRQAARIAAWLAREQVFLSSNINAMRGWFGRAERLLAGSEPCVEQGWVELFRASMLAAPHELEQTAVKTLALAQQQRDPDLEAYAIAFSGLARVSLGQVARGMADLDEAMAAAFSGELDTMTVSEIFCVMLSACELAGDLVRTEHWCQTAARYAEERRCPFLSAYCRATYGTLLTAIGRWQDADETLSEAIRLFEAGHQGLRSHAVIQLADLRVYQGRLEEAEVLLTGYEDDGEAVLPLARLYLARGETALAQHTLEHAIQSDPADSMHQAPRLRLLVDVHLKSGDAAAAGQAAARLAGLAAQSQSSLLAAQAALAEGRVKQHTGDAGALQYFETALACLQGYEQSILAGRARLEMARLVRKQDPAASITWARAALASFQRIGAAHDREEAAQLLRQLGALKYTGTRPLAALTRREDEVYALLQAGLSNHEIAGRLVLSGKTVEHHVTSILNKLGVNSRSEAIALALKDRPLPRPAPSPAKKSEG